MVLVDSVSGCIKNMKSGILRGDVINVINVKLCMMVLVCGFFLVRTPFSDLSYISRS